MGLSRCYPKNERQLKDNQDKKELSSMTFLIKKG
jgi:hypothetical protein